MTPNKVLVGQVVMVFAIVIGVTWIATQWTASQLGYQPRLSPPWFVMHAVPTIGDVRVYYPWRLFQWWYVYEAYAPSIFVKGGTIAAASGVLGAVAAIVGSVWRGRQSKLVTTYGSARWASRFEIAGAKLTRPLGVFLVIPTLLSWPQSAVIHDIKGENWQLTSGWRSRFSHCLLFNPTDVCSWHVPCRAAGSWVSAGLSMQSERPLWIAHRGHHAASRPRLRTIRSQSAQIAEPTPQLTLANLRTRGPAWLA